MDKMRLRYPVGQQSFEQLRKGGFLYVDKSIYIERLLNGSQYYFLSRPRRFGKSLFLSMLRCFFEGKRELFKGLHIDTFDWDWEEYPVFYLDLNTQRFKDDSQFESSINQFLGELEEKYGVTPKDTNPSVRFGNLIKAAAKTTGKNVVILVDEYDKPLVNNLHNPDRYEDNRGTLSELYSNFKSSADYIQMVFLTGVSRFGKLSIFSDLNNIRDISFERDFDAICGITSDELLANLSQGIDDLAVADNLSFEEELEKLKKWYDGYHFTINCPVIYNPFSLLNAMAKKEYGNYWIDSGTPTILVEQLKRTHTDLARLVECRCGKNELKGLDIDDMRPMALLYQTGYLTIKHYDPRGEIFSLGLPNDEVKEGFFQFLLPRYTRLGNESTPVWIYDIRSEIEKGDVDAFMKRLTAFFAGISYEMALDEEKNVQNALLILLKLIGMSVDVEFRTSDGRIDILMRTQEYIYIIELKFDGTAEEALQQIERKEYSLPWSTDRRKVIAIGIAYSSSKRRLDSWQYKA